MPRLNSQVLGFKPDSRVMGYNTLFSHCCPLEAWVRVRAAFGDG